MDADLIVVGGGPVGLAAACVAAVRGARVIVVDRHRAWPVDKACGEGLMPPAVAWLTEMGVTPYESHSFRGIRYIDGPLVAEAEFPDGEGLGVRRSTLSSALARRAEALGVALEGGREVLDIEQTAEGVRLSTSVGPLSARWLVGADGLHSRVRTLAGIPSSDGPARFGLRRHFEIARPPDKVEVHWHTQAEAYVTPVSAGAVGVAILRGAERLHFDELLALFPDLRARLGPPIDQVRGSGPFAHEVAVPYRGRVALVGDAAGYVDALTGEGLALGWRGASTLIPMLLDGRVEQWPRAHHVLRRRHVLFTRFLLWLARHPRLRRRVVAALAASPAGFAGLLGFNSGHLGLGGGGLAALQIGGRLLLATGHKAE